MDDNIRYSHSDYPEYGAYPCTDSRDRLYVRLTSTGTVWMCHDCGQKGYTPATARSPAQTIAFIKQWTTGDAENAIVRDIKLPPDTTNKLPTEARVWLKKYGITPEEVDTFGIGWSESSQRLLLPVYKGGKLIYYQGRTFKPVTKSNPKYRNIRQSGAKSVFFIRGWDNVSPIQSLCIVEDIISAIKVGRHMPTLALLGSYFPSDIYPLYRLVKEVHIWLDEDKYLTAIKEARKVSSNIGIRAHVITTPLDPKENRDGEIERVLHV